MVEVRGTILSSRLTGQSRRVVEPELDMKRRQPQRSAAGTLIRELMRWLAPGAHANGGPMRSIARELEEVWPSREL
ncbi:MAG: hypothetical protein ACREQ4_08020 [Candidatus Binataceae bacterium]